MSTTINKYYLITMLVALTLVAFSANASIFNDSITMSERREYKSIGIDFRQGWTVPTSDFLRRGRWISAPSLHLRYIATFGPATEYSHKYQHVYQGVGVSLTAFSSPDLGMPNCEYVFQGSPIYAFTEKCAVGYEWNFGYAEGWEKYDVEKNPFNSAIGSSMTAYMNLGFWLRYDLSRRFTMFAGVDFSHFSNGNTAWPNGGVNVISARIGLQYNINVQEPMKRGSYFSDPEPERYLALDVMTFGAYHKRIVDIGGGDGPQLLGGNFGVVGFSVAPMYNLNRYFAAGISLDAQYDEGAGIEDYHVTGTFRDNIKFYRPPFHKQIVAGLSARAEFIMPMFTINAGIGYGFVGHSEYRKLYQTLTLKTFIYRGFYLNVGYRLREFSQPDNLMLGAGYRFRLGH